MILLHQPQPSTLELREKLQKHTCSIFYLTLKAQFWRYIHSFMLNCSAPVKCSIPVIVNSLLRNAPKITDRLDDNKMARKYYPGLFHEKGNFWNSQKFTAWYFGTITESGHISAKLGPLGFLRFCMARQKILVEFMKKYSRWKKK